MRHEQLFQPFTKLSRYCGLTRGTGAAAQMSATDRRRLTCMDHAILVTQSTSRTPRWGEAGAQMGLTRQDRRTKAMSAGAG
jgi:hypothetical protein